MTLVIMNYIVRSFKNHSQIPRDYLIKEILKEFVLLLKPINELLTIRIHDFQKSLGLQNLI